MLGCVHPQRADQADGVQRRRAQPVDQTSDVGDRLLGLLDQPVEQTLCAGRVVGDQVAGRLRGHRQGGELRPESVVQVPS